MGEQAFSWTTRCRLARFNKLPWYLLGFTSRLLVYLLSCASSDWRETVGAGMVGVGGLEPPWTESPQGPPTSPAVSSALTPTRWLAAMVPTGSTVFDRAAWVVGTVTFACGI